MLKVLKTVIKELRLLGGPTRRDAVFATVFEIFLHTWNPLQLLSFFLRSQNLPNTIVWTTIDLQLSTASRSVSMGMSSLRYSNQPHSKAVDNVRQMATNSHLSSSSQVIIVNDQQFIKCSENYHNFQESPSSDTNIRFKNLTTI